MLRNDNEMKGLVELVLWVHIFNAAQRDITNQYKREKDLFLFFSFLFEKERYPGKRKSYFILFLALGIILIN